jgi:uncharacterized phage-like protein YoqJ
MNIWVSGYRNYELNIYQPDDQRIKVLKHLLAKRLLKWIAQTKDSVWVLAGGQPGIEQWALQATGELKKTHPQLKTALLLPFADFAVRWKPDKQETLANLKKQVDFCAEVSRQPYKSPKQLRNWQAFMLRHTSKAVLVYDPQHLGKSRYDYQAIKHYQRNHSYQLELLDMDQLEAESYDYLDEISQNNLQ